MAIERNHSIDSLKCLCALLVVFIHCKYPYKDVLLPITDVAVPLFFCISGYFVHGAKRSWDRIKRIVWIFAWSAALYFLKTETFSVLTTHSPWIPSWHAITNFLFFNDVAFSIHLWYLPAYIYVLVMAFFIDKYNLWKASFYTILPLLLIGVFIKYSISDTCPKEIQYYRNAYFCGLPYFLAGGLIKVAPPQSTKWILAKEYIVNNNCDVICREVSIHRTKPCHDGRSRIGFVAPYGGYIPVCNMLRTERR